MANILISSAFVFLGFFFLLLCNQRDRENLKNLEGFRGKDPTREEFEEKVKQPPMWWRILAIVCLAAGYIIRLSSLS